MTESKMNQLLELIDDFVNESGAWKEKADALKVNASADQLTALFEFVSWFEEQEEEEEGAA